MIDKTTTIEEAVKLVNSNSLLALGGMTLYRRPVSFVISLIKHYLKESTPENLSLLAFTAGYESDLLVGSGMVSSIRSCYFGLEIFGLAPMFTYMANRGLVQVIEETEASIAFGIRAQLADIGFMPGRGWIGTDLPRLRPDVKTVKDPYSGEDLMAFPAIKPDVAVIHALESDVEGNAIIGRNKGIDEELSMASTKVIITTEKIVPSLERADIVAPLVDAVVLAPGGAKPSSCHPIYPIDGLKILDYTSEVSEPESYRQYINNMLMRDSGN